jgi:uncharacterized protein
VPSQRWHGLSVEECRTLLTAHHFGRVAFIEDGEPIILPVNYVFESDAITFRSDPGAKLAATERDAPMAFELDGVDPISRTGWSVLVRGHAQHVTDRTELTRLRRLPLFSWAPGPKSHYVRISPQLTSGRRITVVELHSNWWG